MSGWREDCEVLDWPGLVAEVRPTPEHDWHQAWEQADDMCDMGLLDWCVDLVARSGTQYRPIIVREGVIVVGLEQALAWYKYGPKAFGRARIYVKREEHAGEPTPG